MRHHPKSGGQGPRGFPGEPGRAQPTHFVEERKKELEEILRNPDGKRLVLCAEKVGKYLYEGGMSTGQVRAVLNEIQSLKEFDESRLHLLRIKFAYAAGRHQGSVKDFQQIVDHAIHNTNRTNFPWFKHFIEGVVAYHRYYGGRD